MNIPDLRKLTDNVEQILAAVIAIITLIGGIIGAVNSQGGSSSAGGSNTGNITNTAGLAVIRDGNGNTLKANYIPVDLKNYASKQALGGKAVGIGGKPYAAAHQNQDSSRNYSYNQYTLGRRYEAISGTFGLVDAYNDGRARSASLIIFFDGKQVYETTVTNKQAPKSFAMSARGVEEVAVEINVFDVAGSTLHRESDRAAIGGFYAHS